MTNPPLQRRIRHEILVPLGVAVRRFDSGTVFRDSVNGSEWLFGEYQARVMPSFTLPRNTICEDIN